MKNLLPCVVCGLALLPLVSCSERGVEGIGPEQGEAETQPNPPPVVTPSAKEEVVRFRGGWAVIKAEIEGKRSSDYEDGPGFVFGERDFRWSMGLTIFGRYSLDPTSDPKRITLEWINDSINEDDKVVGFKGIYELSGDRIKACFDLGPGNRPTSFVNAGKKGSSTVLMILERETPRGNEPLKD